MFCRGCERFLSPPQTWQHAQPESRELLGKVLFFLSSFLRCIPCKTVCIDDSSAICLKKVSRPLMKVRLIDASFVWTEPHSRRLKIKITIQKEILAHTILEQTFVLTLVVHTGQCPSCTKLAAKNTWKAMVQVRQKVTHKRTFLLLEQLILKHNAHKYVFDFSVSRQDKKQKKKKRIHAHEGYLEIRPVSMKSGMVWISSIPRGIKQSRWWSSCRASSLSG